MTPTPITQLHLIRHAEVEAAYQKVFGGRLDIELSPRGHEQALMLATYLRSKKFDAVYASPMKRVQLTLAPSLKHNWPTPVILPDLREVDFGDWTGHGWDDITTKFGVSAFSWVEQLEQGTMRNAEPLAAYRARVDGCLQQILREQPGQSVAVFCHGGVIRMLLALLLDLPFGQMKSFNVDYASLSQIDWQPAGVKIQLLNFTPWRDLPT